MIRYAITDRRLNFSSAQISGSAAMDGLLARCLHLASTGIDFLLIREKDLPATSLLTLARAITCVFRETSTRVLIARRPDIALAAGAHGVHLSASPGELTAHQVRTVFPSAFVSRSCHTVPEVMRARAESLDAILFGPVFGKTVAGAAVAPPLGLDALRAACRAARGTPVISVGGVTARNAVQCMESGAAGIASIRMFFAGDSASV